MGTESTPSSSNLLDMTPNSWADSALVAGQTFTDPDAGITITTQSVSSSGATVQVTVPQATVTSTCTPANPSLAVSPSTSGSTTAGTVRSYTLTVTDNDDSSCSAASFNLTASVPSGWSAAFDSSSLTLSPGASASTTVTLTSSSAPAGTYTATFNASNVAIPAYSASATVTYGVALNVVVSTDKPNYAAGSSVTVTTVVQSGGSPLSGATVNLTITKPNGTRATTTMTTGASGAASYVYKLKRNGPTGTWQVNDSVSKSGASGSGSAVFSVQ